MRTRIHKIQKTKNVERVDLSHLKAFRVKARPEHEAMTKQERLLTWEVRDMFKHLSYDTVLNEKRDCRHLSKPPVKEQIVPFKKKVTFATSYDILHDTVLGTYRRGKNFVKRRVDAMEVVQVIDWDNFAY